ncbi:MAG: hypothetical protein RIB59_03240 [Rhodospirillales bacterium]
MLVAAVNPGSAPLRTGYASASTDRKIPEMKFSAASLATSYGSAS